MKKTFLTLLLLLCAQQARAAITIVQGPTGGSDVATGATCSTLGLAGTAGHAYVLMLGSSSQGTSGAITVADNNGLGAPTYSTQRNAASAQTKVRFAWWTNIPTNASADHFAVTDADGSNHTFCSAWEVSGLANSSTLDQEAGATVISTVNLTTNSITTTGTDMLVAGFTDNSSNAISVAGAWTLGNTDTTPPGISEYQTSTSAGAYNGAATLATTASANWIGGIVSLKAAAAGGGGGSGIGGKSGFGGKSGIGD
jgi:hypothetical protein